jgi:hypothetical protein
MQKLGPQKLSAKIKGLYLAAGDDFVSKSVETLELSFEGIKGDYHAGLTRRSGGREPWYKRGTEMRNERQLSLLSVEEMEDVAQKLEIEEVDPGLIGGNILLEGVPNFSNIPPRTQMFFPSGAVIRIDGYNAPCAIAGESLQTGQKDRDDIKLGFVKAAKDTRGLVGWVEVPGAIHVDDEVKLRIWPQELYVVEKH